MDQGTKKRSHFSDEGFSLLETLIALAILSLTSLILFQSTGTMLSVSEKAALASERVIENAMSRKTFNRLVGGLTPGWKNQANTKFQGNSQRFSGLSINVPAQSEDELAFFTLEIQRGDDPESAVLNITHKNRNIYLKSFEAETASFQYLSHDNKWYDIWPPETIPSTGFFNDVDYIAMPNLPLAVRFWTQSPSNQSTDFEWTAIVNSSEALPYRSEFQAGG